MSSNLPKLLVRYAVAVAAVVLAVALRVAFEPWLGNRLPFITAFGAVAIAVWVGGVGPAVLAAAIGFIGLHALVRGLPEEAGRYDVGFAIALLAYAASAGAIIAFGVSLRHARARLESELADRRVAERRALDAGERLAATLQSIGDGVIVTNLDGRVTSLNPVAEALTGWSRDQAVGAPLTSVFDIVAESTGAPVDNPALRALAEGRVVGLANHTLLRSRDGAEHPIDDSAGPIRHADGHVAGAVLVFRDIAERRAREEETRRANEALETLIAASPIAIVVIDPKPPVVRSWNAAAQAMFGWSADEVVGRPIPIVPDALLDDAAARRDALRRGVAFADVDAERLRRDGSAIDVRLSAAPLRGRDGQVDALLLMMTDATEARRAARTDARLAAVVRHATEAVVGTTPQGRIELWNPAAERLFGYRADEIVGHMTTELIPAERLDEHARRRAGVVDGGRSERFETVLRTQSGATIEVMMSLAPIRDERARVVGISALVMDIGARKQAERSLRRSESLLRAMYEGTSLCMGIVELTDDGDILHLQDNAGTCRLFGVPPGATANRRASALGPTPALIRLWIDRYLESARTGHPVSFEFDLQAPGGRGRYDATVSALESPAGERPLFSYVCEDVTARHRADQMLRQSEANARLALDVAEIGTWSWDPASDQVEADARCRRICGLPERGPMRLADVGARIHPDDRDPVDAARRAALDPAGSGFYANEFRFVHDDGSVRWVVSRGQLLGDDGRSPRSGALMLGTVLDITARKQAEHAAAESDRRKSEFIAILAHELRNPLAPIRSGLEVLRRAGDDATSRDRSIAAMERQLAHMVRMVDDLLDISRISRDQLELRRRRVDLATVVDAAVEASRPQVDARGQLLRVAAPDAPVFVDGDETRLVQVLTNLLDNAAKYTPDRGTIAVAWRRDGDAAEVRVSDTGAGIPAAQLPRAFEMFERLQSPGAASRGGLGIGLAISKRLMEMHGGTLTATSDGPGRGSTFSMRLAAAEVDPAAPGATAHATDSAAPGRRVLIADDNVDAAESMGELLALSGYVTGIAHDGVAALEVAERLRPEIALLDIGMPGLDGHEVARRLKARGWAKDVLLVAVTGWGQQEDRRRSAEAGFDHHLVKPVDPFELLRLLEKDPLAGAVANADARR